MKYLLVLLFFLQSDIQCWYCHVEFKKEKVEYWTQICGPKTKKEAEKYFGPGSKASCIETNYSPLIP